MAKTKSNGTNPNENYITWHFGSDHNKAEPEKHYRGEVKLSIVPGNAPSNYSPLKSLIDRLEKDHSDDDMDVAVGGKGKTKGTKPSKDQKKKAAPRTRLAAEKENVSIIGWIYAAELEKDNDFHVILGDTPTHNSQTRFFNVEVAGLPANNATDYEKLLIARKNFVALFPNDSLYTKFVKPKTPIKVKVKGSLFFDGQHYPAGKIGPSKPFPMHPKTTWEIHPVFDIQKG